jgi:ABC-type polysaccharide/polyol phosphate transport system ATPase subunit
MTPITARLQNVSLYYARLGTAGGTFRGRLADGIWKRSANTHSAGFCALKDVSFTAHQGDRIAIIGANGAGKTTLLRVISQIFEPDAGTVEVFGSVIPLLGHFPGVSPDATGYENVKLAAYTMGIGPDQIPDITADVAEFTELGEFLEQPIKTYSAGMSAKLLFAIMTSFTADIFALDEFSFATGDHFFKSKAQKRSITLMERAKTVFLASHDADILRSVCNRAILLEKGRMVSTGAVNEVLDAYHALRG